MRIVTATFVNNEVEPGWAILSESVPLGKQYRVDLDRVEALTMRCLTTGKRIAVECIYVLEPGPPGYLPLLALKLETGNISRQLLDLDLSCACPDRALRHGDRCRACGGRLA